MLQIGKRTSSAQVFGRQHGSERYSVLLPRNFDTTLSISHACRVFEGLITAQRICYCHFGADQKAHIRKTPHTSLEA